MEFTEFKEQKRIMRKIVAGCEATEATPILQHSRASADCFVGKSTLLAMTPLFCQATL
jgi:hypothetical protein